VNNWNDNVPNIATNGFNGGHGFKTSLVADFEKIL
jgi:hypothetical protein